MSELPPGRNLSDADLDVLAAKLERRLSDQLVRKAGTGILQLAWRGVLLAILALAAYAVAHSGK